VEFFDVVEQRHSMRSFRDTPVPRELIERAMYAASRAPSAYNEQPWVFYVLEGQPRKAIAETMAQSTSYLEEYLHMRGMEMTDHILSWYSELGGAPVVIAIATPFTDDEFVRLNRYLSVGAAIENLLLAATDLGLAACNITFSWWVRQEIAELIDVPTDHYIVAMVALGYPDDQPPLAPPHRDDVAHYLD
jgi:nitroreductase